MKRFAFYYTKPRNFSPEIARNYYKPDGIICDFGVVYDHLQFSRKALRITIYDLVIGMNHSPQVIERFSVET